MTVDSPHLRRDGRRRPWLWIGARGLLGVAPLLVACSGGDGSEPEGPAAFGGTGPGAGSAPNGAGASAVPDTTPGVNDYDRPLGMPIGQGAPAPGPGSPGPTPTPDDGAEAGEELEIPVFTPMDAPPPCSGCVELNVLVDDINQRDNFVFSPGNAVNVTRVVWTIIVPFNSDQLFVQPFVDNAYGTFTDLDANAFAINTPVQLVHEYSGAASTVGLAVGSSGAWTGNMTMSVFVDSVTLEGADASASRTFDADLEGLVVGSNTHSPRIVYHP